MNLCADLKSLATISFSGYKLDPWNRLLKHLQSIITNDVSPYFVAPVVLALTVLCSDNNLPSEIKGPAPDSPTKTRSQLRSPTRSRSSLCAADLIYS